MFLVNVSPVKINFKLDDVKISDAQRENDVTVYKEPTWQQQNLSQDQKNYPTSGNCFQIGQHVYLDRKTEVFDNSFFAQVTSNASNLEHAC